MLKAIKNFFKREQHTHHHNHSCSAVQWRDACVIAMPDGKVYILRHDYVTEQDHIQEIRLGW